MATLTIDTVDFIDTLTRAKMPKVQAEAVVKALEKEVRVDVSDDMDTVSTKHDIELLKQDTEILRRDTIIAIQRAKIETIVVVTAIIGVMLAIHGYFLVMLN